MAYLVLPKVRSRIAGYFHLSNHLEKVSHPTFNGSILVTYKALRHVVPSSVETKTAGVFVNSQQALHTRHDLMSLNHPQPPTLLKTDNSTTNGFVHKKIATETTQNFEHAMSLVET